MRFTKSNNQRIPGLYRILWTFQGSYAWDIVNRMVIYKEPGKPAEYYKLNRLTNTQHRAMICACRQEIIRRRQWEKERNAVSDEAGSQDSMD